MQYVSDEIMARVGKPFDPNFTITVAVSNALCAMVYGERYDTSDAEFVALTNNIQGSIRLFFEEAIGDFIWLYSFKPSYRKVLSDLKAIIKEVNDFNEKKVKEIRQRVEQDGFPDEPGNFIEAYLKEIQCETAAQGKIQQSWLPGLLNDFFFAGSETTSVSIAWALLWLADRQDVQAKVGLSGISHLFMNFRDEFSWYVIFMDGNNVLIAWYNLFLEIRQWLRIGDAETSPNFLTQIILQTDDHGPWNYNRKKTSQIAKFLGPTWGPPGSCRHQMGPMLAPCWPHEPCYHGCLGNSGSVQKYPPGFRFLLRNLQDAKFC